MNRENPPRDIWPDWILKEHLASGTFGDVYRAEHRDHPELEAAVKLIDIPRDPDQIRLLKEEGLSDEQIAHRYDQLIEAYTKEIRRMDLLKGTSNIVSVEDFRLIPHEDGPGATICIRMEKLRKLKEYLSDKELREDEVIRLGIDICHALEICHLNGILHLDIKPGNIFVNDRLESGVLYKLGDFGSSLELQETQKTDAVPGTLLYLSPEMSRREKPDGRADIYSLGLTLYWLMNDRTPPFLTKKQFYSHDDLMDSTRLRLSGQPLPNPVRASAGFAAVIRKACAFDPNSRYAGAADMREALEKLLIPNPKPAQSAAAFQGRRSRRFPRVILAFALLLVLACAYLIFPAISHSGPQPTPPAHPSEPPIEATSVPMIPVINEGKNLGQAELLADALLSRLEKTWDTGTDGNTIYVPSTLGAVGATSFFHVSAPQLKMEKQAAEKQAIQLTVDDECTGWDVLLEMPGYSFVQMIRDEEGGCYSLPAGRIPEIQPEQIWISASLQPPWQAEIHYDYDIETMALIRGSLRASRNERQFLLELLDNGWYRLTVSGKSAAGGAFLYDDEGILQYIVRLGENLYPDPDVLNEMGVELYV